MVKLGHSKYAPRNQAIKTKKNTMSSTTTTNINKAYAVDGTKKSFLEAVAPTALATPATPTTNNAVPKQNKTERFRVWHDHKPARTKTKPFFKSLFFREI